MVGEDQRPGARAAFTAVDGNEVHSACSADHQPRQLFPEGRVADGGLDADRQPGFIGNRLDEVEHLVSVPERAVRGRADTVAIGRHTSDLGDLRGDLGAREQAADTRLGALTEFDLDRANLWRACDDVFQPRHAEVAIGSRQPK